MSRTTILGLMGQLKQSHFAALDTFVASMEKKNMPVGLVKIDPFCKAGIEWALVRGMAIVIEPLEFTYQRHTVDEFTKLVIGEPTTMENYATPSCEIDMCRSAKFGDGYGEDHGNENYPLSGDFLPDQRTHGQWVMNVRYKDEDGNPCHTTGEPVNIDMLVVGGTKIVPNIDGMAVERMW